MKQYVEKIKDHCKENQRFYLGLGMGLSVAGFTCLIMRGRYEALAVGGAYGLETADTSVTMRPLAKEPRAVLLGGAEWPPPGETMRPFIDAKPTYWAHRPVQSPPTGHIGFTFSNTEIHDSFNVVNAFEREGRGHPGYLTRCLETKMTWPTQKAAAYAHGVHPNRMSDHLNGRLEHLNGNHFERIYLADN